MSLDLSFRALAPSVFETFHADFRGDTYEKCVHCGGCEYALIGALLPGEADYMAHMHPETSRSPEPVKDFRARFLDQIVVRDFTVDVLRLVLPCKFLEEGTGRCLVKAFKPVLCEIYPLTLSLSERGDLQATIDPWCPLSQQPAITSAFREKWRKVAPLFRDLDTAWVRCIQEFDPYTYDTRALQHARGCSAKAHCSLTLNRVLKHQLDSLEALDAFASSRSTSRCMD